MLGKGQRHVHHWNCCEFDFVFVVGGVGDVGFLAPDVSSHKEPIK
jgi:hypothetical protein